MEGERQCVMCDRPVPPGEDEYLDCCSSECFDLWIGEQPYGDEDEDG